MANAAALVQASATVSAGGVSAAIDASGYTCLALLANVTALSGSQASVVFSKEGLGADGVWYTVWTSKAQGAPAQVVEAFGPGLQQGFLLFNVVRVRWALSGVNPQATFSLCVVGR